MSAIYPLWTLLTHVASPLLSDIIYTVSEEKPLDWEIQDIAKNIFTYLLCGTLVSVLIAAVTPAFHNTFSFLPSNAREGFIVLAHLAAPFIGLTALSLLNPQYCNPDAA